MVRANPPLKPIIVLFRAMTRRWEASDDKVPEWMLQPMQCCNLLRGEAALMRYQSCVCPVPQCSEQLRSKDLRQPGDMPSECPNCGNGINWDTCAECNLVWNWSSVDRPAPKALHGKDPWELLNPGQNSDKKPLERGESLSPITAQGSQRNSIHSVEQPEKERGDGKGTNDDQVDDEVVQQALVRR